MAPSSTTLPTRRNAHPAVAHTVDALLVQERTRWAIRIHDGLTQSVTSAVLELQTLRHRIETDPESAIATLKEVEAAIRNDLSDIREVLSELYDGAVRREPPIAKFVTELVARWHLPARVSIEGHVEEIFDGTLETANAIVAEALANAAKHSGSTEVSVRIRAERGALRIEVEDRGRGFRRLDGDHAHFGLRMMRSRADEVGGTIQIDSNPGSGTRVVAVLPVGGGQ